MSSPQFLPHSRHVGNLGTHANVSRVALLTAYEVYEHALGDGEVNLALLQYKSEAGSGDFSALDFQRGGLQFAVGLQRDEAGNPLTYRARTSFEPFFRK